MKMIIYNILKAVDKHIIITEIHDILTKIAKQYDIGAYSFQLEWSSWKGDNYQLHNCFQFGSVVEDTPEERTRWEKITVEVNKQFPGAKAILFASGITAKPIHEGAHA